MATLTITIPDDKLAVVLAAYTKLYPIQDETGNVIVDPTTAQQAANAKAAVRKQVVAVVLEAARQVCAESTQTTLAAAEANIASVTVT